jgi:ribosome recycling factor
MRRGEKEAQDITDEHTKEIDKVIAAKEKEIMTV